jgi:multiple sugar transport system substrate-binding protein
VRRIAGVLALSVIGPLALTGCGGSAHLAQPPRPTRSTPASTPAPISLSVGFYGSPGEIAAYRRAVDNYDAAQQSVKVTLRSWPSAQAMMSDLTADKPAPDVFLAGRGDLDTLQQDKLITPVDELLAARNVDLGDDYSREALEAFSANLHLTCMPYGATPQVIYYNTDLVDFPTMQANGLATPSNPDSGRWTLSTFSAAAENATRPASKIRAFALPTTVEGLAPYLYSGQGKVVDNEKAPTSLAFSDASNQDTWNKLLAVLSAQDVALTASQLKKHTPLQWFERGKLAMLVGDRTLTPTLRQRAGLHWDVISLPSVSGTTTVGDYSGLCLNPHTEQPQAAADLLAYLVSRPAEALVAQAGYLLPVNTAVAMSDDFLQPTQQPAHAKVFVNNVRSMRVLPIPAPTLAKLDGQVAGLIGQLFKPGADVAGITAQIDATSTPILAALNPSATPSTTPSAMPPASPSVSGAPSVSAQPSGSPAG